MVMLNGTSFGMTDSALEISKQQLKFGKELTSGKYGVSNEVVIICLHVFIKLTNFHSI